MNKTADAMYSHRRARLQRWMREQRMTGREVAKTCGWASAAHVTNLVRGHSAFGEKIARQVEEKLRMPAYYLDQQQGIELESRKVPERPATLDVVRAVLVLRDEMGPAFMSVPPHKVDAAVRLILANPDLAKSAAELIRN